MKIKEFFNKLFAKNPKPIFIPTKLGLNLVEYPAQQEPILAGWFGAKSYNELTEEEHKACRLIVDEISKTIKEPKLPDTILLDDLTPNSLVSFEEYSVYPIRAPYFLACIFKKCPRERKKYAEDLYTNMDFREFWSLYNFFFRMPTIYSRAALGISGRALEYLLKKEKRKKSIMRLWNSVSFWRMKRG